MENVEKNRKSSPIKSSEILKKISKSSQSNILENREKNSKSSQINILENLVKNRKNSKSIKSKSSDNRNEDIKKSLDILYKDIKKSLDILNKDGVKKIKLENFKEKIFGILKDKNQLEDTNTLIHKLNRSGEQELYKNQEIFIKDKNFNKNNDEIQNIENQQNSGNFNTGEEFISIDISNIINNNEKMIITSKKISLENNKNNENEINMKKNGLNHNNSISEEEINSEDQESQESDEKKKENKNEIKGDDNPLIVKKKIMGKSKSVDNKSNLKDNPDLIKKINSGDKFKKSYNTDNSDLIKKNFPLKSGFAKTSLLNKDLKSSEKNLVNIIKPVKNIKNNTLDLSKSIEKVFVDAIKSEHRSNKTIEKSQLDTERKVISLGKKPKAKNFEKSKIVEKEQKSKGSKSKEKEEKKNKNSHTQKESKTLKITESMDSEEYIELKKKLINHQRKKHKEKILNTIKTPDEKYKIEDFYKAFEKIPGATNSSEEEDIYDFFNFEKYNLLIKEKKLSKQKIQDPWFIKHEIKPILILQNINFSSLTSNFQLYVTTVKSKLQGNLHVYANKSDTWCFLKFKSNLNSFYEQNFFFDCVDQVLKGNSKILLRKMDKNCPLPNFFISPPIIVEKCSMMKKSGQNIVSSIIKTIGEKSSNLILDCYIMVINKVKEPNMDILCSKTAVIQEWIKLTKVEYKDIENRVKAVSTILDKNGNFVKRFEFNEIVKQMDKEAEVVYDKKDKLNPNIISQVPKAESQILSLSNQKIITKLPKQKYTKPLLKQNPFKQIIKKQELQKKLTTRQGFKQEYVEQALLKQKPLKHLIKKKELQKLNLRQGLINQGTGEIKEEPKKVTLKKEELEIKKNIIKKFGSNDDKIYFAKKNFFINSYLSNKAEIGKLENNFEENKKLENLRKKSLEILKEKNLENSNKVNYEKKNFNNEIGKLKKKSLEIIKKKNLENLENENPNKINFDNENFDKENFDNENFDKENFDKENFNNKNTKNENLDNENTKNENFNNENFDNENFNNENFDNDNYEIIVSNSLNLKTEEKDGVEFKKFNEDDEKEVEKLDKKNL